MSNYIEFKDKIAFHPGYYIEELVEASGLSQKDYAERLNTTPKNLCCLIKGEQSLSGEMAMRLAKMLGTSTLYWLNLQSQYDALCLEFEADKELEREREIFRNIEYKYFVEYFGLENYTRKTDLQIKALREFLQISSLEVLKKSVAASFRSDSTGLTDANIINANAMVQIAVNEAIKTPAPKFDKRKFMSAINYALSLTQEHDSFLPLIRERFNAAGVVLVVLPNLPGSRINGATKRVGENVLLMVNDRRMYSDIFWFSLFHEIGHIVNGDYGISLEDSEDDADEYARNMLIPNEAYKEFILNGNYSISAIKEFSEKINRDPSIVVGRLLNDKLIDYQKDFDLLKHFRKKYKVQMISVV